MIALAPALAILSAVPKRWLTILALAALLALLHYQNGNLRDALTLSRLNTSQAVEVNERLTTTLRQRSDAIERQREQTDALERGLEQLQTSLGTIRQDSTRTVREIVRQPVTDQSCEAAMTVLKNFIPEIKFKD